MVRRTLLPFLLSLLVVACKDASGPAREMTGTWHLETVNGLPLPFQLEDDAVDKLELIGEEITLDASHSLTIVTIFRVTEGTDVYPDTIPDSGTYTVNGSTVILTWDSDGSTTPATVNGDTMTINEIGLTFIYRRPLGPAREAIRVDFQQSDRHGRSVYLRTPAQSRPELAMAETGSSHSRRLPSSSMSLGRHVHSRHPRLSMDRSQRWPIDTRDLSPLPLRPSQN